ncbi:hypothetical protein, partial [Proteiniphilum acetatigenes]|uniref:hypothetical protein n=1 Tax=Proteiniphilum acetatigenes TaxID=294710 RepID=UPI0008F2983A
VILSEVEQRNYVGAAFYYSPDGELLGHLGNSHEIRVVDSGIFYSLQYNNDDACLFGYSTSLYYSDNGTRVNIINSMARGLGLDYVYLDTLYYTVNDNRYISYDTGGKTTHMGTSGYGYQYSYITINNASDMFKGGNFYDMMCALIHEQDHYDNYNPQTYNKNYSEFFAFGATIHNQYFEYASQDFRESTYSQYRYYESLYYNLYY